MDFKAGDLEKMRVIESNIFLRVSCLKCGGTQCGCGHMYEMIPLAVVVYLHDLILLKVKKAHLKKATNERLTIS